VFALVSAFLFPLVGCGPTRYQARGATGGYSETRLAEDTFRVSFNGNGYTSSERAEDFALLRSAEIALAYDFPYFVVVDGRTSAALSSYQTPTRSTSSSVLVGNTIQTTTTTTGGQTYTVAKPSSSNTIILLRSKPEGLSYEAIYVANALRAKYNLPRLIAR